jgi:hypothetical protein
MKMARETNGLYGAIEACARRVEAEGKQYVGKDVLRCVKKYHPNLIEQVRFTLSEKALLSMCSTAAKRRTQANVSAEVAGQMALAGFDKPLPASIKFYDGTKTAFIAVFAAKESHWLSHIKLQEDNIKACAASIEESRRVVRLIRATGKDATFGEALAYHEAHQKVSG